ncbi:calcium/sodium antiporter [Luteimonas chenhongjianii]|uniref:calcium/sodium antiporter n=1 Tax=Luteimonas chenhongjianii TaxID=2006110 RepID=UPI001FEC6839|nr:calcium/sodium antiporter [Luteimonas chenhongjianii]
MITVGMLLAGFALLVGGADLLVRGAARLAAASGLSPLVIGLTVVAVGTSAPELATSIGAALSGSPDIALGNVIGSNIANVLLILGLTALIAPLTVSQQLVRMDVPIMLGVSLLVFGLSLDGDLGRGEGIGLLALALAYVGLLLWLAKRQPHADAGTQGDTVAPVWWRDALYVLAGLALLVLGARWLVGGAVRIAELLGVSEMVIGLTVVAVGTSLPELATSILATVRGQRDMAVGNIVGSCIFNLLLVLGATAALSPTDISVGPAVLRFDLPVMTAVALACLPIFFTGFRVRRWEGALFVAYYVAYTAYLLLRSAHYHALPAYSMVMMGFVVPLTAITLALLAARAWRYQRRRRA